MMKRLHFSSHLVARIALLGLLSMSLVGLTEHAPLNAAHAEPAEDGDEIGKPEVTLPDSVTIGTGPWPSRPVTNWAFGAGESLSYSIGWEKVTAGHATMVVNEPIEVDGRLSYPIVSTVKSTSLFSSFYKVDDRVETRMDVRELYPLRFDKRLHEGSFRSRRRVEFDPKLGVARTATDTFPVPPYVLDDLSMLYYVRAMELTPGQDIELDIYSGKKLYRLQVKVLRKERIRVEAGEFSTIVVEPLLQSAGLFKSEGKVTVWLTDDRLHMPVLMKSKVMIGSIVAELDDYRLGQVKRY